MKTRDSGQEVHDSVKKLSASYLMIYDEAWCDEQQSGHVVV